ncbi:urease accessory protein UreF [Oryzifoliimicrobium ureilyticus]|uniref:urease accessory protein UreF n=1 Tax=Oryzifoliimicrobium ureilyticus TaxID=3113724 RepID=UPI0030764588
MTGAVDETQALLRLMAWLSPAFPIGSFAYSGGLERAVHDRLVQDADSLRVWIETLLRHGSVWNDAVLLAESHRSAGDEVRLGEAAALAEALAGGRERHQETMLLGAGFLTSARAWPSPVFDRLPQKCAYPVAVGAVAGAHGVPLTAALAAYLHAYVSQAVSAGIRLSTSGQKDGLFIVAGLEPVIGELAERAANSTLDDLGSSAIEADIATLRHEVQPVRLFRS